MFVRDSMGDWDEEQQLTSSDADTSHAFGWSVDIDGDQCIVGANGVESNEGAAYSFTRSGTTWTEEFIMSSGVSLGFFGHSVAIDDDVVHVGAYLESGFTGGSYVYTLDDGFLRGDANDSGGLDLADALAINAYIGGTGSLDCLDAADVNDDGGIDISDSISLTSFLFSSGRPPAAPYPDCGTDLTGDSLDCATYTSCP